MAYAQGSDDSPEQTLDEGVHDRLGRIASLVGDVETSQGLPEADGEESEQGEEDSTLA